MKRGFRLIFQAGGPAFLRSAALFPVVKCVEVCACQIDRLTNPKTAQIKPSKYKGVSYGMKNTWEMFSCKKLILWIS